MDHFRSFVRAQMTWPRLVNARYGQQGGEMSNEELVAKMLERGAGNQPSTTEYILQQVIFVVPEARRGAILGQRQSAAEQMRARFGDCSTTRQFAAQLTDVAVRDLGRVMQPELPPDWKDQIVSTEPGGTTATRTTDRGVEFIAVCSARQVSDDRAAAMVFQAEEQSNEALAGKAEEYLAELKERASISYR
jgi:peptidyl-prolyl cis-trans isomerase SurA